MAEYSFQAGYYEWLLMIDKNNKLIAVIGEDAESIFEQPNDTEKLTDFELIESYSEVLVDSLINQAEELLGGSIEKVETNFSKESSNEDIKRLKVFLEDKNNVEDLINTITDAYCAHYGVENWNNIKLTADEIQAYLEKFGFFVEDAALRANIDGVEDWVSWPEHIADYSEATKKEFFEDLNKAFREVSDKEEWINEAIFEGISPGVAVEEQKLFESALKDITNSFGEKFDKCMAEFHKNNDKDYKNPQRNAVKDSENVGKGAVATPVSKKI